MSDLREPTVLNQDPHASSSVERSLEAAIGREVRRFRTRQNLTVAALAKRAGLSAGMLSKIENGVTSPSLTTLQSVAEALMVPVTALFQRYEELREATFVPAGQGLAIERHGTRAGHQYQLLGHATGQGVIMEPYLITMESEADDFPVFQHDGVEFIYMVEGEMEYRHNHRTYRLRPGDSLYFDADAPHGPEVLAKLPIRFLSVISYPRANGE
ncbi:MAG: helix-turn-helix domain-containing protein [Magnetovibrionaceae bacterium]